MDLYCEVHSRKISFYELNLTGVELVSRQAMAYSSGTLKWWPCIIYITQRCAYQPWLPWLLVKAIWGAVVNH